MARVRGAGRATDRGETLIEIIITVVIIGIAVTALVSALGTSAAAGGTHRNDVGADTTMRNYAEAAKAAARDCTPGAPFRIEFTPPTGFLVAAAPSIDTCPDVDRTAQLTLTVTGPTGALSTMDVKVRTP